MEIDLVVNNTNYSTGLSCYSSNLKKALSKMIRVREIDTNKCVPKIILALRRFLPFNVKAVLSVNPIFLPIRKNAVVHLTTQNFALPLLFYRCKNVVTVHDMVPFENFRKELHKEKERSFFNRILTGLKMIALKKADRIIAISSHTKKRVIKILAYPPERVKVVYYGIDRKQFKLQKTKRDPFTVLYVGSEMPRKNLPILLKAFAKLKKSLPEANLVKIGPSQWHGSREKLKKLISELGISDSVISKDYSKIKDHAKKLASEYNRATVFVHPSLYEGFGLPLLEAMSCGCPVICSNKTSLPEVAENAAIYFDGYDVDDLAKKMHNVLTDKKLQNRLRKKGIERAKKFSWEKAAKETLEVYKKI